METSMAETKVNFDEIERSDLELIDISWIGNPKSATYLAVFRYMNFNLYTNIRYRRTVYDRTRKGAESLIIVIDEELNNRK